MKITFRGRRPLMQRQFEKHKEKMLAQCEVVPQIFDNMVKRLDHFAKRYVYSFCRQEQRVHAELYLGGLVSDLERKNIESIAYRSGEDRYGLQHFIGSASWEHEPLIETMVGEVAAEVGDPTSVIVFDPSGFEKQGRDSVGVSRQWIGRLGKVDNGQVAVYMGYASEKEHILLDTRLYLPKEWIQDKKRREKCGVPKEICYQTRHELALEMLQIHGPRLPHAWIAGDDEMGQTFSTMFRVGVPLLRILSILKDQVENPRLREVVAAIGEDVETGTSMAEAFAKHPKVFPPIYCSMLAAGEASGNISVVMEKMCQSLEYENEVKNLIKGALQYPIIVLFALIIAFAVLMGFVIPAFLPLFR